MSVASAVTPLAIGTDDEIRPRSPSMLLACDLVGAADFGIPRVTRK